MKNLPVKLLYPALAAAALLSAASAGLFAASYNSYVQCRCSQTNMGGNSWDTCCADTYWGPANKTNCCTNSTAFKNNAANGCTVDCSGYKCTTGIGGWVIYDSTDYQTCPACCGSGMSWTLGGASHTATCGSTTYTTCSCSSSTTPPAGQPTPSYIFQSSTEPIESITWGITGIHNLGACNPCMGGVAGMGIPGTAGYGLKQVNACAGMAGCVGYTTTARGSCYVAQSGQHSCGVPGTCNDVWVLTCA